jgi:glycosyltransferase involved in cell wall biosynthesis
MKIDYITAHDPRHLTSWSGLNYFIMKELEALGADINIITNLSAKPNLGLKWRWYYFQRFKKNYQYERTHCYTRQFGQQVNQLLRPDADIVFSTYAPALPYINTKKPVFLYTDATFNNLAEYYDHFSRLPASSKHQGDTVEKLAFENCAAIFFASKWAAQSAIDFYQVAPAKVQVVPFGANLLQVPTNKVVADAIEKKIDQPQLVLLLLGVEFSRKGGYRALAIVECLRASGVDAHLWVAGIHEQPDAARQDWVKWIGPVDKIKAPHQIDALLSAAHFLLVPSERECFGVVYAEANAWGVPAIGNNTGGVDTAIENGYNGILLEPNESAHPVAQRILKYWQSKTLYQNFCQNSRLAFDDRFNWTVAGKTMMNTIQQVVQITPHI